MFRHLAAVLTLVLAVATSAAPAAAADLPPAAGPVVLTLSGNIANANRGPVDPFLDGFFAFHEIAFERAVEFDVAALEALGIRTVTVGYPNWPGSFIFEGPLLGDVLAAAGAGRGGVTVTALDGYVSEISAADIAAYPIVLALRRDGRALGIGGKGPLWLIYPRDGYPALEAKADDAGLAWAVFHIAVQ